MKLGLVSSLGESWGDRTWIMSQHSEFGMQLMASCHCPSSIPMACLCLPGLDAFLGGDRQSLHGIKWGSRCNWLSFQLIYYFCHPLHPSLSGPLSVFLPFGLKFFFSTSPAELLIVYLSASKALPPASTS